MYGGHHFKHTEIATCVLQNINFMGKLEFTDERLQSILLLKFVQVCSCHGGLTHHLRWSKRWGF